MKNQNGLTLIETLIYMGLLSIILVVLTEVLYSTLDAFLESRSYTSLQQDSQFILTKLANDIKAASSVTTPASIGGSGGTLEIIIDGDSHNYLVSSNNLVLTNPLGAFNLNSSDTRVSSISFTRLGTSEVDSIRINLTIESSVIRNGERESKNFVTTVQTRL